MKVTCLTNFLTFGDFFFLNTESEFTLDNRLREQKVHIHFQVFSVCNYQYYYSLHLIRCKKSQTNKQTKNTHNMILALIIDLPAAQLQGPHVI